MPPIPLAYACSHRSTTSRKPSTTSGTSPASATSGHVQRSSVLVERWDEDWSRLGWLRLNGRATLLEPGDVPPDAVQRLRDKYPQYATHALESSPMIAIDIERATSWGALDAV